MIQQDEGVLDPWVAEWVSANGAMREPPADYTPEYLAAARSPTCPFPIRDVANVTDELVDGIPVRISDVTPTRMD